MAKIRPATKWTLHEYSACLITHEHKDHSHAIREIALSGLPVYCSEGTSRCFDTKAVTKIEARRAFIVGPFTVLPFEAEHDASEPLCFLIKAGDETLLFATDTYFVRYRFQGLTQIAIECNWSEDDVAEDIPPTHYSRLKKSHMSLCRLQKMLYSNDLSQVEAIHLLHISESNGNSRRFTDEIQKATGIPTYCIGE